MGQRHDLGNPMVGREYVVQCPQISERADGPERHMMQVLRGGRRRASRHQCELMMRVRAERQARAWLVDSRVMVTGSSGRIGQAVAERLTILGVPLVGIDRRAGTRTHHVGDLATLDLPRLLQGCEAIVHTAALHAPHVATASAPDFVAANVTTTMRLIAAARDVGVARFVFTSTTSIYGKALEGTGEAVWVDETLVPIPRDIYDATKFEAEQGVGAAHDADLSTITLRVARCFPEPLHALVVNRLYRGVDLRDVVDAIVAALTVNLSEHHVVNVVGPRVFERSDTPQLWSAPATVIDKRVRWLRDEFAVRGWALPVSIDRVYVSRLASSILGHRPAHDVRSALGEITGQLRSDIER